MALRQKILLAWYGKGFGYIYRCVAAMQELHHAVSNHRVGDAERQAVDALSYATHELQKERGQTAAIDYSARPAMLMRLCPCNWLYWFLTPTFIGAARLAEQFVQTGEPNQER